MKKRLKISKQSKKNIFLYAVSTGRSQDNVAKEFGICQGTICKQEGVSSGLRSGRKKIFSRKDLEHIKYFVIHERL